MIQYQKDHGIKAAAVIGGGLLGLEAAKAMYDLGMETHIIEYAPILMCRQVRKTTRCPCHRWLELWTNRHVSSATAGVIRRPLRLKIKQCRVVSLQNDSFCLHYSSGTLHLGGTPPCPPYVDSATFASSAAFVAPHPDVSVDTDQ